MILKRSGYLILFALLLSIIFFACKSGYNFKANELLWYTYPAQYWNSQALHLGNGYLGASFFGGTDTEIITLTEKSLWTGGPYRGDLQEIGVNPKSLSSLPKIRSAVTGGNIHKADSLTQTDFLGDDKLFGNFSSIGELLINFNHHHQVQDYRRELDLSQSLGKIHYRCGNVTFFREYFCSYPDRVLALHFTASLPGLVNFSLAMNILQDSAQVEIKENNYYVNGFINENNRPFAVHIRLENSGGQVFARNDSLYVENADSVVVYLTAATNYRLHYPDYIGEDPDVTNKRVMNNALKQSYSQIRVTHIQDYQNLFNRVHLQLKGSRHVEKLSTDSRWLRLKSGQADPGLKALAFNLGRYMLISSSRPGTLPANLQGVWNNFKVAPWAGNYQSNINLQENYMSCGPVDLPECQQAYIDWIRDLSLPGAEIARLCYGTGGWVSHSTGNIWGHAAPRGDIMWGTYPVGAAWHCQHLWEQYAYTLDSLYLQNTAYPLMKGACIFWLQNLVQYQGYLISSPAVSAEHGALLTETGLNPAFHDLKSDQYLYNIPGVYQDIEMIWELFTNTARAANLTGDNAFADSLLRVRAKLPPLKIGQYGQLQEWFADIDNPDCHHRHIAHLYAVYPGTQINPLTTPEFAAAAGKSLDMRGDGRFPQQEQVSGGNWARAHRIWCWTRLLDGNRANKIFTELLTEQGFENLLTFQHIGYHWERPEYYHEGDSLYCHFQLDAVASTPGFIAEMLLQSHLDEIHLLPALPDEFITGSVSGLKARGGYRIDLTWKNNKFQSAVIYCPHNQTPRVRVKDTVVDLSSEKRIKIVQLH